MTADARTADPAPEPVLLEGMRFDGLLVLPHHARIDGRVRGEVLAGGTVWVGPTGVVEADLEAEAVVVEGRVDGNVWAERSISLGADAVVRGDLCAPTLAIEEGARIEGRCACGDARGAGGGRPERAEGALLGASAP